MAFSRFDKERILVTGGAGFIGSHLCERLLEEGNSVLCLDNYFTGQKRNIFHLLNNPYFDSMRHDLVNPVYESKFPYLVQGLRHDPLQDLSREWHNKGPWSPFQGLPDSRRPI